MDDIRLGISIKFIDVPNHGIIPNQYLEGSSLGAAIQLVDEPITLKVMYPHLH